MNHALIIRTILTFSLSCPSFVSSQAVLRPAHHGEAKPPPFTKLWVYPQTPDSALKYFSTQEHEAQVCKLPPPWEKGLFGDINGMGCDAMGNLYVWDDGYPALWKFSPSGQLLWRRQMNDTIHRITISRARGAFAVAPDGEVCVGDFDSKTLTLLDRDGHPFTNFKISMKPASITFGRDTSLYVAGFEISYSGPIVHHYSRSGELLAKFCDRDKLSKLVMMTGNAGRLAVDSEGDVYYSFFYPYKIIKFSPSGDSLASFTHHPEDLKPPFRDSLMVRWTCGIRGMMTLPSSLLLSVVYSSKEDWGIDVFDQSGSWLKRVPSTAIPVRFNFRYWAVDHHGNLYFDMITKDKDVIMKFRVQSAAFSRHN